uniref:Uncharacterized protein n=2 Tax=Vibrionaceae TaxID=641 RepID=A0A0H3ZXY5_9VIBR|nr:hypothetical protein [Enterovibrio norvegicus]AKN39432.1 hypothetical protein [Vibrio tasmaniensis]
MACALWFGDLAGKLENLPRLKKAKPRKSGVQKSGLEVNLTLTF